MIWKLNMWQYRLGWLLNASCLSISAFVIGIILAKGFPAVSSHRCILLWVVLKYMYRLFWVLSQNSLDRFLLWFGILWYRTVCKSELEANSLEENFWSQKVSQFLLSLPFHQWFYSVCPVLKVHEEQNVPGCFKCVGKKEEIIFKEFSLRGGGSGRACGRDRKLRHQVIN